MNISKSEAGKMGYEKSKEKLIEYRNNKKQDYINNPKYCLCCNEVIPFEKRFRHKFCNRTCSATYNNKLRNKDKNCLSCGKELKNKSSNCCNYKCHNDLLWKQRKEKIKNGDYNNINSSLFKKYVIEIRGYRCEKCSNNKWLDHNIPLNLHHKDGDSTNNNLDNLELLCLNCHGITPNYGRKNKNLQELIDINDLRE